MKTKNTELDVDQIGSQDHPISPKEKEAISNFIKAEKAKRALKNKALGGRLSARSRKSTA